MNVDHMPISIDETVLISAGESWSFEWGLRCSLVHQRIMFLQASDSPFLVIPLKRCVEGLHTSTQHLLACLYKCMLLKTMQGTQHDQYA